MMRQILCSVFISFGLFFSLCSAQAKKITEKLPRVKVIDNKPGVYITYERIGKAIPIRDTEIGERIWLRFHNNMRWSINFCAYGYPDESYGEYGVYYDVEANEPMPRDQVPGGEPVYEFCDRTKIPSTKSIVFSIPRESLSAGLLIKVGYGYEWESPLGVPNVNEPIHYVRFSHYELPKDIREKMQSRKTN